MPPSCAASGIHGVPTSDATRQRLPPQSVPEKSPSGTAPSNSGAVRQTSGPGSPPKTTEKRSTVKSGASMKEVAIGPCQEGRPVRARSARLKAVKSENPTIGVAARPSASQSRKGRIRVMP